jgi:hypothetical protein
MNLKKWLFLSLALMLAAAFVAPQLPAQTQTTGDISGVVTDQTGGVVPQAHVTLKDNTKGSTQDTQTSKEGVYRFYLLAPGSYTVNVSAPSFPPISRQVDVNIGQISTIDVQLSVASSNTVVTVTEAAPLVQTENGNVATTMSEQQVSEVPNPGNDLSYMVQTAPGVVMNTSGGFGNFAAFGIGATSNLFTIDGMDDNDPFLNVNNSGATNLLLGANEIQEASIVSNGYSGEYGSLAGSSINYITKSGGNDFHGNAIYYWNGRAMNANDWFLNNEGQGRTFSNANQWAASLGGPIKKDKAFFFFNTEGLRVVIPTTSLVAFPSPQFQAATIANLTTLFGAGSQTVAFYNNIFSLYNGAPGANRAQPGASPTDPIGCFGFTGLGGSTPCSQFFQSSISNLTHEYQVSGRGDWNVTNNDRAFLRILYDHGDQATFTDPINSLFNTASNQPQWQGQLNETHTFGSSLVNQFILSGAWYSAIFNNPDRAAALAAFPTTLSFPLAGIEWTPLGGGEFNEGDALNPSGRRVTQYQVSDDVSKTFGKHTLKVGMKFRRNDVTDLDFGQLTSGLAIPITVDAFFNGGNDTVNPVAANGAPNTSELVQAFPTSLVQPFALYTLAAYAEDDWRVKSNLTLTFALRAEHQSNAVCNTNCFSRLNGPFLQADNNVNTPYSSDISVGLNQMLSGVPAVIWQPRFGFAWQPLHNTVVRGGAGIFNDAFPGVFVDDFAGNPPNVNTFTVLFNNLAPGETENGGNLFNDASNNNIALRNAFANNLTLGQIQAGDPNFTTPNLFSADRTSRLPQYQKWNLDVQHQFGANTSVSLSYNGNHGVYELINRNGVNAFGFGDLPAAPFDPRFNIVNLLTNSASSNYNGVTASFKQNIHGWGSGVFQANYTYSHALDDVSNAGLVQVPFTLTAITAAENPFNTRFNYGPADYDVRHSFTSNYVWEVPVRRALGGRGWAPVVDGWQVSGTIFARTGFPYTVVDAALDSALGNQGYGGAVFPAFLGGPIVGCGEGAAGSGTHPCFQPQTIPNPANPLQQIPNPNAQFVQAGSESGFTPGLRNAFRAPNYFNTDFTVVKNTKIPGWERGQLGLGFQFFNLFNHPNFAGPNNDISSGPGNFGHIFSTVSSPTSILGSFLGANASPRLIQLKADLRF